MKMSKKMLVLCNECENIHEDESTSECEECQSTSLRVVDSGDLGVYQN